MPKYYTTLRITTELHKKIVKAKGRIEATTGEIISIEEVLSKALDALHS